MTNEIEATKRLLFHCLDRIRRAGKHRVLTAEFEGRLEEHLEALRKELADMTSLRHTYEKLACDYTRKSVDLEAQLVTVRQANTEIQERLHAVDRAYFEQSQLVGVQATDIRQLKSAAEIAGEELRQCQTNLRHWREEAGKLNSRITAFESGEMYQKLKREGRQYLDDCRSAEKLSDDLSEKLTHATTVIGQQEQLIAGQRSAIAGMHAELTHSRVIRKAFIRAQEAFTAVDAALHESAPYNAQKALGDDLVDAEFTS